MAGKDERKVKGLKVRYIGDYYKVSLIKGKVYDVIAVDTTSWATTMYRIIDETHEDYLFSAGSFKVVQNERKGNNNE
jgi:hypothetical protein